MTALDAPLGRTAAHQSYDDQMRNIRAEVDLETAARAGAAPRFQVVTMFDDDRNCELDERHAKQIDVGKFYTVEELAEDLKKILRDNVSLEVTGVGSFETTTKPK